VKFRLLIYFRSLQFIQLTFLIHKNHFYIQSVKTIFLEVKNFNLINVISAIFGLI